MASPWSPPAWMKTNSKMNFGGRLRDDYREAWANYYCKFIEHYENEDIPIWGLSVQNEPAAKQTWDSCLYTGEEERDFIKNYLGPSLKKHKLLALISLRREELYFVTTIDKKILIILKLRFNYY